MYVWPLSLGGAKSFRCATLRYYFIQRAAVATCTQTYMYELTHPASMPPLCLLFRAASLLLHTLQSTASLESRRFHALRDGLSKLRLFLSCESTVAPTPKARPLYVGTSILLHPIVILFPGQPSLDLVNPRVGRTRIWHQCDHCHIRLLHT